MSEDRCVVCGEIVPEGRNVCPICAEAAEDIIRRMSIRIRELEKKVRYHETTIRTIYAKAIEEAEKSREAEFISAGVADYLTKSVHHNQTIERERAAKQIKIVCTQRNFDLERET